MAMMVTSVEEMQQRTGEQERVWDKPEQMLPVCGIKEIDGDKRRRSCSEQPGASIREVHSAILLSRSALLMTLTDESAMAAAAKIGESMRPNSG